MTQDIEISDQDVPIETLEAIKKAVKSYKKLIKKLRKKEEITEVTE